MKLRALLLGALLSTLAACGGSGGGGTSNARNLSVAVTGSGTVSAQPSGENCSTASCTLRFNLNATVTLTAAPASGFAFSGWGGACSGTAPTCTVSIDDAKSVTATFTVNTGASFALNVSVVGNGSVTSQPAGINCGTACSGNYADGTSVRLTATPAAGHVLSAWSGACAGTAACAVSMTQARTVTATFVPSTSAATPTYEALSAVSQRQNLLDQTNAQGARGFQYVGPRAFSTTDFANVYVKDINTTYSYEILDTANTAAAMLAQMNAQGARGYAFYGPDTSGTIYVKDNTSGATYSYEMLDAVSTEAAFLAQANAQGDRGFYFSSPFSFISESKHIYVKDNSGNAKYAYRVEPSFDPSTPQGFITQADAQGQLGYRFDGPFFFSGNASGAQSRHIYVKDTSQAATFQWQAVEPAASSAAFVTQANAQAASAYASYGPFAFFPSGTGGSVLTRELYFKPVSCSGQLCRATSPL